MLYRRWFQENELRRYNKLQVHFISRFITCIWQSIYLLYVLL